MIFVPPPPPVTSKVIYLGDYAEKYGKVRDILYYHATNQVRRDVVYLSAYHVIKNTFHQRKMEKQRRKKNKSVVPPSPRKGK